MGVDWVVLDVVIGFEIFYGGWCFCDCCVEDGEIDVCY